MNLLERVTKARSVDITILATSDIGKADSIDVRVVSGEELLNVISLDSKAVSVMIRGGAYQSMDEIDRGLHDCLMVVSDAMEDQSMLAGGGSSMEAMAVDLRDFAKYQGGKEQLAIEAYADALESIPLTLARNGGMDALEVLLALRTLHVDGNWKMGVDYDKMGAGDMVEGKVLEPFRVVKQAIQSATEVAIQVIRVDDMLIAKPLTETHPDLATNSIGR
jgi:chaperonin GroEL (HSP60 family)